MKRILVLMLCVLFLCSCGSENVDKTQVININSDEVSSIIKDKEYIIVDVREENEYNIEHVKDSINISVNNIDSIKDDYDLDTIIIVYCKSGNRSSKAASRLIELGYKKVYDLGGIDTITLDKVSE